MTQFFPGQRLKKVRGGNLGIEGVFVNYVRPRRSSTNILCDCRITSLMPCISTAGLPKPPGFTGYTDSGLWEPILPEGLESNEEIDALYQPDTETSTA